MSSKGTRVFAVRLPASLVEDVDCAIAKRNEHSRDSPWRLSDFIRVALTEKLAKMARSRGRQLTRRTGPVAEWFEPQTNKLKTPDCEAGEGFDSDCWAEA